MTEFKNLVVVGQGAPNTLKGGRISRCICAYSEQFGLLRIYPVPNALLRQWDVFDAELVKNSQDHRENTWKVNNSKVDWGRMSKWLKKTGEFGSKERKGLIEKLAKDNLGDLILNKKSFGIIKPKIAGFELEKRNETTTIQTKLFDLEYQIIDQNNFKFKPYVLYECSAICSCKNKLHRQQIVEWGCFEWMRKNPNSEEHCKKVFDNLRLLDADWEKYFLVGNLHKSPQTYVIVGVLRFKKKC